MNFHHPILGLTLYTLLSAGTAPQDAEADAWKAAMDLKTSNKSAEGAAALEAFRKSFPDSPRVNEALVEEGVCWMQVGRSAQVFHRNKPGGAENFVTALKIFAGLFDDHPDDPFTPRAEYCAGSAYIFLDDLAKAEKAYGTVIQKYPADKKYFGKSLERRSAVRRHRFDTQGAISDLERYQKDVGKDGEAQDQELVTRFRQYAQKFDKPAPALAPEAWGQGEPVTLASLHGEIVAVYFFATWCHNCAKEVDFIRDLNERWTPMGLKFIGVTDYSQGQTPDVVRAYMATEKLTFPVMIDHGRTAASFQGNKIPDLVLIDREGKIRWHDHPGNLLESTLELLLVDDPSAKKTTH